MLPEYIVYCSLIQSMCQQKMSCLEMTVTTDACLDMCQDARCGPGVKHSGDIYGCFACTFLSHSNALMCGIRKPQWLFKIQKYSVQLQGQNFSHPLLEVKSRGLLFQQDSANFCCFSLAFLNFYKVLFHYKNTQWFTIQFNNSMVTIRLGTKIECIFSRNSFI